MGKGRTARIEQGAGLRLRAMIVQLLQVAPCGEGSLARAGENGDADIRHLGEAGENHLHLMQGLQAQGVTRLRPVDDHIEAGAGHRHP